MALSELDKRYFKMAIGGAQIGKETSVDIEVRCPVCGDSKKSRNKKRLHLYQKGDVTQVNCFNGDCQVSNKTVYSFLRDFYPELLPGYRKEHFKQTLSSNTTTTLGDMLGLKKSTTDVTNTPEAKEEAPVVTQDLSQYMIRLKDSDAGVVYLRNRGIEYRPKSFGKWYYGTQDLQIGDTYYKLMNSIIVPLYYKHEMYGFYSRSTTGKEFVTYMNDVNIGYKIWNWFNVDHAKPVYIFEGIFDAISSGMTNSIALLGAKLPDERLKELSEPVFCLDRDETGLKNMKNYAKDGYKVYVQPSYIHEKDMNEIMLSHNFTPKDMQSLISSNIHSGLSAVIKLNKLL